MPRKSICEYIVGTNVVGVDPPMLCMEDSTPRGILIVLILVMEDRASTYFLSLIVEDRISTLCLL